MNDRGASDPLLVSTRAALLDAIEALSDHASAVIIVGAQAVHLNTGDALVALAESTKDADIALDPSLLKQEPLIEAALLAAKFRQGGQPGQWTNREGTPVDLLLPSAVAGISPNRRSVRIPPHANNVARNTRGIEGCLVDNRMLEITALDPADARLVRARVAGTSALLVAKAIKIGERLDAPDRLNDKDAHDIYRLLVAADTQSTAVTLSTLLTRDVSAVVAREALSHLRGLFADTNGIGSVMAGRAERGIGDPEQVAQSVSILVADLLDAIEQPNGQPL